MGGPTSKHRGEGGPAAVCVPQALQSSLGLGAEEIGDLQAQHFLAGEAAQALRHRIRFQQDFGVRIKKEQGVAAFFKQRARQFRGQ